MRVSKVIGGIVSTCARGIDAYLTLTACAAMMAAMNAWAIFDDAEAPRGGRGHRQPVAPASFGAYTVPATARSI